MKQILICCFILFTIPAFSQFQTQPLKPEFTEVALRKETADLLPKIYINDLQILDSRNDTTNIGYSPEKRVKQYLFKKGFTDELDSWFSTYLHVAETNNNGHKILVNIRKLRVSDEAVPKIKDNGEEGQPRNGWHRGIIAKIEYFLQEDSLYIPLYRFDSIVPFNGHPDRDAATFFSMTFKLSLDKIFTVEPAKVLLSKNRIALKDIVRVNNQGRNYPIYSNADLKRGIYKTFEDFKVNKISWTDFELRPGKLDVLYVKENENEYPIRTAWGFCDGKDYYIKSGDVYSQLVRCGYDFYFAGIKSITGASKHILMLSSGLNYATDTGPKKTVYKADIKYYQLDMDNGLVY
ncbi:MAG: hypothetical protein QM737_17690 [Ferruginibacter sp.]